MIAMPCVENIILSDTSIVYCLRLKYLGYGISFLFGRGKIMDDSERGIGGN